MRCQDEQSPGDWEWREGCAYFGPSYCDEGESANDYRLNRFEFKSDLQGKE